MASPQPRKEREFKFSDKDFGFISKFVYELAGIVLADHKKNMVYSRLVRRLRALGIDSFADYISFVSSDRGEEEIPFLINAVTTNLTSFFREKHHFDFLEEQLKKAPILFPDRKISMWSAGCSAGMEVYSMAITLAESLKPIDNWNIKLLATDIDSNMLQTGFEGIYEFDNIKAIHNDLIRRYFKKLPDGRYQVADNLRAMVHFKKLNLIEGSWPIKTKFPFVFCRNVMIYFDKQTQAKIVERFSKHITDGGHLIIGHSENLLGSSKSLQLLGKTIYKIT